MKEANTWEADPCDRSRRENVIELIGEDLWKKAEGAEALLLLIDYRMKDAAGDHQYGISRLFIFDALYGKKPLTRFAAGILTPALWALSGAKHRSAPKAKQRLTFSNTFLLSARYPAARAQIERETGCTAVLAFSDLLKLEGEDQRINLKGSLKLKHYGVRPIFFRGRSVCGSALEKAVVRYCDLVYDAAVPESEKTKENLEKAVLALKDAYLKRVEKAEECLRKEDCGMYITVNQYNLRDLLMIHACRNLGIRTFQQEHHAMQFCRVPFDTEHPKYRFSLVGEYGFWNRTEQLFHEKVYRYDSPLYRPEEIRFRVTGNPEMNPEEAEQAREKYPPERKLTFMIASLPEAELEGKRDAYEAWRWEIFRGLKELAEKQHVVINIRYTPNRETEFREKEVPVLKEWGFRISESVPGNLMEDMCSSCAILSSASSVLCTARMFGKLTFRVADWEYDYVHVDDEVHEVTPAEIGSIVIPEGAGIPAPEIDPSAAFSIRALL